MDEMPESIRLESKIEEVKCFCTETFQYLRSGKWRGISKREGEGIVREKQGECAGSCGRSVLIASNFSVK